MCSFIAILGFVSGITEKVLNFAVCAARTLSLRGFYIPYFALSFQKQMKTSNMKKPWAEVKKNRNIQKYLKKAAQYVIVGGAYGTGRSER